MQLKPLILFHFKIHAEYVRDFVLTKNYFLKYQKKKKSLS